MADTWRVKSRDTVARSVGGSASPHCLASEVKRRWQAGEEADAVSFIARHPHLRADKSIVLDLAVEEFLQRLRNGEALDPHAFAQKFDVFRASIQRLVLAEKMVPPDDSEPDWPEIGGVFLGLPLHDELGRGGFARVYLASQPELGNRRVALKVCPKGGQEAHCLGKLQHPNIVPVHSTQQDPETKLTAICMPYLGRATLCDVLDRAFCQRGLPARASLILAAAAAHDEPNPSEPIDPWLARGTYIDGVLCLGQQMASALQATHEAGLFHLDLKPTNVLLTPNGRPMLLDFNLSLERDALPVRIGGTLPYMSPEQIQASVLGDWESRVDGRSDVFSLGVLLHELLVGTLPFGSVRWTPSFRKVGEEWLEAQRRGPRSLSASNPQIDASLARVIERCLMLDPAARWQTAGELAEQLGKQLHRAARARRWARSHRKLVYGSVLLAAALAGGAVGYAWSLDPYWVRQSRAAEASIAAGDYADAIERLNIALQLNPNDARLLEQRARAFEGAGEFQFAATDYNRAARLVSNPRLRAREGYCLNRAGDHSRAQAAYEASLNGGFESARVLCNLGMTCLLRSDRNAAKKYLSQALHQDDSLGMAYYGRARSELDYISNNPKHDPQPAINDIEQAVKRLTHLDVYWIAAQIYDERASANASYTDKALTHLERAVDLGLTLDRPGIGIQNVTGHPRYQALLPVRPSRTVEKLDWFLDPTSQP